MITETEPPAPNLTTEDAAILARVLAGMEGKDCASFPEIVMSDAVVASLRDLGFLARPGGERTYYWAEGESEEQGHQPDIVVISHARAVRMSAVARPLADRNGWS